MAWSKKAIRKLNRSLHRDLGYFASALMIAYCISGIALNHVDAWNPDFVLEHQTINVPTALQSTALSHEQLLGLSALVGEADFRVHDVPTAGHVKLYFDDASLHVRLNEGVATFERVSRRPLFYQVNVLHRNTFKPWRWGADVFAVLLIIINLTGLFVMRGRYGLGGRGKWLVAAGFVPPLVVLALHG